MIRTLKNRVLSNFKETPLHDKLYKFGGFAFVVYALVVTICRIFFGSNSTDIIINFFIYFICIIFTFAVFAEYYSAIRPLFSKTLVKLGISVVAYFVYRHSEIKAANFINNFTELDPSLLPDAYSLLSTIFLPYSWGVLFFSALSIYIIIFHFTSLFTMDKDREKKGVWKFMAELKVLAKFTGLITTFIILMKLISAYERENSWVTLISKEVIIKAEYFKKTTCDIKLENRLVADIGRGYISVFTPKSEDFKITKCQYKLIKEKDNSIERNSYTLL